MPTPDNHDGSAVATLANGVRVLTIRLPQLESACASVFVRSGSAHETKALNGISHVVEHMVFKGTRTRGARRINLDAERLGAEVNAHTDKDHTAFHMRGMAADAERLRPHARRHRARPAVPGRRARARAPGLLHECTEDEDDPLSTASSSSTRRASAATRRRSR